jgi:hypothetical protein
MSFPRNGSAVDGLVDSIRYPKRIVSTILEERTHRKGDTMGAVIMLGTLFGLIALIFGLVLRFDPEARRAPKDVDSQ